MGPSNDSASNTPRMIDVARLAGVSQQTVSRVLNGNVPVSKELTLQVEQAVRHLGYRRNNAARALVTRQTMNLGVISVGTAQYGPAQALFGIAEQARESGYATSLMSLGTIDRDTMQAALDHLVADDVDGIVVLAPTTAAAAAVEGLSASVPLVMFEPGAGDQARTVAHDEGLGARTATRHLLDLGHPTVHHLGGPDGWLGTTARINGWRQELTTANRVAHHVFQGDWSAESGYEAGHQLLRDGAVTAVFAANDQMALGLLKVATEKGIDVPGELSVVGFDDIPEARYFRPALTTMRLDFIEVGRQCVSRLLGLIDGTQATAAPVTAPYLISRDSTAPFTGGA